MSPLDMNGMISSHDYHSVLVIQFIPQSVYVRSIGTHSEDVGNDPAIVLGV